MMLMNQPLYDKIANALKETGHADIVDEMAKAPRVGKNLTSTQAAALLGVSSPNTVKSWLEGGAFPGAFQTPGGHWRFPLEDVLAAKERMEELRDRNRRGDLSPSDDQDTEAPPLL